MPFLSRPLLILSHASALAAGCWLAWPDAKVAPISSTQVAEKGSEKGIASPAPHGDPAKPLVASDAKDFAYAWEILRLRELPPAELKALQLALLEKWSIVDLEAALRASIGEFPDSILGFDDHAILGCDAGILATPDLALQLIRNRTLGLGTAALREKWTTLFLEKAPEQVLAAFGNMTGEDRYYILQRIAFHLCEADTDASVKQSILAKVISLHGQPGGLSEIRIVAEFLARKASPSDLLEEMNAATDPGRRELYRSAFAKSLVEDPLADDDGEGPQIWSSLPSPLRSEIAAEALYVSNWDTKLFWECARLALADGNLDALKAAAEHNVYFSYFAASIEQAEDLTEWALTLPDDPRTTKFYHLVMQGASAKDFAGVRDRILALSPGWQRDQGLAALASGSYYGEQAVGDILPLLEQIADPVLRAEVLRDYKRKPPRKRE